jgi:hypothetical protein
VSVPPSSAIVATPPATVLDLTSPSGAAGTVADASAAGAAGAGASAGATGSTGAFGSLGQGGTVGASTNSVANAYAIATANANSVANAYANANATTNINGMSAAATPTDAAGSAADASAANTSGIGSTPAGDSIVDNIMSGPLPGPSAEPLVSTDEHISVTVARTSGAPLAGVVTVLVPRSVIDTALEFRFPLPTQLSGAVAHYDATQDVRVTRMNGKPLPTWLKFRAATGTFVATGMPMHALPTDVLLRAGNESWVVVINEKND